MRTMTFGSTLHHLTATAVVLQYLSTSSGSLAATITNNEEFIVDQFWQSVDEETFTPNSSLEWLMEREERIKFSETSPSASLSDSLTTRSLLRTKQKEHVDDFHWPASNEETHRLLIRCKADQDQEDCVSGLFRKINRDRIKIVHNLKAIHAISIEVDSETRDTLFADDLELHRDFERTPLVWSEDPTEGEARHLQEGQQESWALKVVRAREVWDVFGVRGRGAKVCLLDTGVDASHEDFEDLSIDGYEGDEAVAPWYEDRRGHGTHITGIIAASDNNLGTVGIAPDVDFFVVKVFDDLRSFYDFSDGTVYSTDLIAAAQVCKDAGANIISASLGGYSYNQFEDEFFRNLYEDDGILTIAAAGNGGDERNVYPAAYDFVFSVSAIDRSRRVAGFATLNPSSTDILAPGVAILSTVRDNGYRSFSGTSMAAPHVTGVVALMLSYIESFNPDASHRDIFDILRATARSDGDTTSSRGGQFGHVGVVDAFAAMEVLANGLQDQITLEVDDPTHCKAEVRLELSTDDKGFETAYRLKQIPDGPTIWTEAPNTLESNSRYTETTCLEETDACYRFDVRDMGNDGIQGTGIKLYFNGHELYRGGSFGGGGMLKFGDGC